MNFFKKNMYLIISIALLIIFMPVSPLVGFFIAGATGYDGILLIPISFLGVLLVCMLPYILSLIFNKTEKQKSNLNKVLVITTILLLALFLFFAIAVPPSAYEPGVIYPPA